MDKIILFAVMALVAAATVPSMLSGGDGAQSTADGPRAAAVRRAGPRQVVSWADGSGHHHFNASMNGSNVRVLVDTGASIVAIDKGTAKRLGIGAKDRRGKMMVSTANGIVSVDRVLIRRIRIDGIEVRDVEAAVLGGDRLGGALLGMSFLKRLKSFRFEGRKLVLLQ